MRRHLAIVVGAIAAIWFVALMHWVATDTVVPWDSKNQFYAFFRFLSATVNAGVPPFWNPYHYAGHPSVADPQSLVFAPAFVLSALIEAAPSIRTFDTIVFAHLLVGGLSIGVIGLRAGWPAAACVLAAAVFMFGGAAAARLQHAGLIMPYGLFPAALLLLQVALQRRSFVYGVAFAMVAAVLALARTQAALLFCYVLVAVAIAEVVTADRPRVYLRTRLPVFLVMGLVGLALIVLPLLLTVQFAALSNRADDVLGQAYKSSLYPANLATLAVADIFGTHGGNHWGPDGRTVPEIPYADEAFNYMFVGAAPIVLLVWLGIAGGGAWRRGRVLLSATLVVALIYMLGRYTPLFAVIFEWVPGVSNFRRPVDANYVLVTMLALLSGHFLSDYVREGVPRVSVTLVVATLVGIAIVAWGVVFSFRFGHGAGALLGVAKAAPAFLAVILVLAWARSPQGRVWAAIIVTAISVVELLYWNVAFRLNAEPRAVYAVLERPTGEDARVIALLKNAFRAQHAQGKRPRMEVLGAGGPWQNAPMVYGFEAINGYNPMRIGRYDRLVAPGESNWLVALRDFPPTFAGYDSRLARLLGLEFLVLGKPIDEVPKLKTAPKADPQLAGPERWVYRLRNPAPRVAFATGAEDGDARIVAWRPDRVAIETESASGGQLVLRDPFYPGWFDEIDGESVPIRRAETLFRGIDVPPGRHHVLFTFAPFSLENLKDALMGARGG